ncbi:MAG: hypothetical protein AAFX93_19090 [Verrucomicrobiota bacterium]
MKIKVLLLLFSVVLVGLAWIIFFAEPIEEANAPNPTAIVSVSLPEPELVEASSTNEPEPLNAAEADVVSFETQLSSCIENAQLDCVAELLATDEQRFLKHLVELGSYARQPNDAYEHDAAIAAQITDLATILTNHFLQKDSLESAMSDLDELRGADLLHGYVAVDLFQHVQTASDAEFVWQWIRENPDTQAATSGGSTVAFLLLEHDAENAWKKSLQLPEGHTRQVALNALVYQIANDDIDEAVELLNTVPDLPDSDPAIAHLLNQAMKQQHSYSYLIGIASSASDEHRRAVNLNEVIMDWARNDADGLQVWLEAERENWSEDEAFKIADIVDNALTHAARNP